MIGVAPIILSSHAISTPLRTYVILAASRVEKGPNAPTQRGVRGPGQEDTLWLGRHSNKHQVPRLGSREPHLHRHLDLGCSRNSLSLHIVGTSGDDPVIWLNAR